MDIRLASHHLSFKEYQKKQVELIQKMCKHRGKINSWREEDENRNTAYVEIAKVIKELIELYETYHGITVNIGAVAFAVDQCMKNIGKLLARVSSVEERALSWAQNAVLSDGVDMLSPEDIERAITIMPKEKSISISLTDPTIKPKTTIYFTLKQDSVHYEYDPSLKTGAILFGKNGYAQNQDQREECPAWGSIKNSVIPHIQEANLWTSAGEGETMTDEEFLLVFPEFAKKTYCKKKRPDKA